MGDIDPIWCFNESRNIFQRLYAKINVLRLKLRVSMTEEDPTSSTFPPSALNIPEMPVHEQDQGKDIQEIAKDQEQDQEQDEDHDKEQEQDQKQNIPQIAISVPRSNMSLDDEFDEVVFDEVMISDEEVD
jgi:hypothetical protein